MATSPQPAVGPFVIPNFNVPLVYINGFNAGLSNSEISAILMHDNIPAIKLVMPLPVAKTLAGALTELVGKYEEATGTAVPTVEELAQLLSKLMP